MFWSLCTKLKRTIRFQRTHQTRSLWLSCSCKERTKQFDERTNKKMMMSSQNVRKVMPNINEQSTKLLNLTVLQRIDPFVEEILFTAAHVTFYYFNILLSQWSRKDVEGSLFVVKRNTHPRFQFIVMNRRSTENLVENLLGDFEFEVQIPYLLYRNAAHEVNGIWFYDARECEEVANLFSRILTAYSKVPQKSRVSSTKSEYEELEAVPNLAVLDGPLEPSSLAVSNNVADASGDLSFVNFFSTAMTIRNTPITGQPYHSSTKMFSTSGPTHAASPTVSTLNIPTHTTLLHHHDATEPRSNRNQITNLVKPSSFFVPPASSAVMMMPSGSSSTPTAPPLNHAISVQRSYGAPLLQPLPPPTPPLSLTPAPPSPNYGPVITREKVRESLVVLVQDNQFIDMVYRALLNSHQS